MIDISNIYAYPFMDSFRIMDRTNNNFYIHNRNKFFFKYQIMDSTYGQCDKKMKLMGLTF